MKIRFIEFAKTFRVMFYSLSVFFFFSSVHTSVYSQNLAIGYNDLFAGSGECAICHNSQVNNNGASVALVNDWRSTMMANSSRDPLWRAKVSAEVASNNMHKDFIEDKCSKCHAPAGNIDLHHIDGGDYLLSYLEDDPFGLDGVQCTVCHQITPGSMGTHSAGFTIGASKIIYGPYQAPFPGPMINFTSYIPEYSDHIGNSELCGTCHTLLTHPVSPEGNVFENEFVEQAILQEWKNSAYPDERKSCQTCHIPRIDGPVVISNRPPWLDGQNFFGQHHFVGANIFMNKIFQDNLDALSIPANMGQLQNTEMRTQELLTNGALNLSIYELSRNSSILTFEVSLYNLGGHKLPTGFPSRRVFVEFIAQNASGDTLLHSGKVTSDFRIIGEDPGYEVHHEVISENNQVQIYEIVMGDASGEPTTELLRAHTQLKDNRLPPRGFSKSHLSYDTVRVAGEALKDEDFNIGLDEEGSGSDHVRYEIPISDQTGIVSVEAKVYYQTISPKWLEDIFSKETVESDNFEQMYENSHPEPVLMAAESMISSSTGIPEKRPGSEIIVFPNPVSDKIFVRQPGETILQINMFDISGKSIFLSDEQIGGNTLVMDVTNLASGIYIMNIHSGSQVIQRKLYLN